MLFQLRAPRTQMRQEECFRRTHLTLHKAARGGPACGPSGLQASLGRDASVGGAALSCPCTHSPGKTLGRGSPTGSWRGRDTVFTFCHVWGALPTLVSGFPWMTG